MKIEGSRMRSRGRVFTALLVVSLALVAASSASAEHLHGAFGLGIIVGEPTGITGKYFLNAKNGIEASAAWSLEGRNAFQLQGDYVYQLWDMLKVERGQFPVVVGIGARIAFVDGGQNLFGIRIPLGGAYELDGAPIDFFGQIVPILDLAPDTDFDLEGAIGVRFYFGK